MLSGIQKVLSGDEDGHLPINYSPDWLQIWNVHQ
jgi:hypothetical protein